VVVVVSQIAPPIPSSPFFSDAQVATTIPWAPAATRATSWRSGLTITPILFSQGAIENGWIVSILLVWWCNCAIRCSGDRNLRNTRICNFLRGWVSGSVWIPIHNLAALSNCLCRIGRIYASASVIASATV